MCFVAEKLTSSLEIAVQNSLLSAAAAAAAAVESLFVVRGRDLLAVFKFYTRLHVFTVS